MRLGILTLSLGLLVAAPSRAQAPQVTMAVRLGGGAEDAVRDVVRLPDGLAVLVDVSYGPSDLGGGALAGSTASLSSDIAIARLDAAGAHVWSRRFGSAGAEYGSAIASDAAGNLYVAGYFDHDHANVGGGDLALSGARDSFVASYDASGAHRWSRRLGGDGLDRLNDLVVDGDAVLLVGGSDSTAFDPGTGTAVGPGGIWLLALGTDGTVRWSTRTGDGGGAAAVAMGPSGPCITGIAHGQPWGRALEGGLIACLRRDGTPTFARAMPGASFGALAVAADGRVFASGSFEGALAGTSLTSAGSRDALVVAVDAAGTVLWASGHGGPSEDFGPAIAWDGTRVIAAADVRAPRGRRIAFGAERFDPGPHSDVVVFALCPTDGHDLFATALGGIDFDHPDALAVEPDGSILLAMNFAATMRAGASRLRGRGPDGALLRFAAATASCTP